MNIKYEIAHNLLKTLSVQKIEYKLLRGYQDIFIAKKFNDIDLFLYSLASLKLLLMELEKAGVQSELVGEVGNYQKKYILHFDSTEVELDVFFALCWRGIAFFGPLSKEKQGMVIMPTNEEQNLIIILKEMLHNSSQKNWGGFQEKIKHELLNHKESYLNLLAQLFDEELCLQIIEVNCNPTKAKLFQVSTDMRKAVMLNFFKKPTIKKISYFTTYYFYKLKSFF